MHFLVQNNLLDDKLYYSVHITETCLPSRSIVALLNRSTIKMLYDALVLSYFTFCDGSCLDAQTSAKI